MSFSYAITNPADLRNGHATATGTLITIPAGRRFSGEISVHAGSTTASTVTATVTTAGTGVSPAAGTVLAKAQVTGLALTTVNDTDHASCFVIAPSTNDVTIEFTLTGTGTGFATVTGYLY